MKLLVEVLLPVVALVRLVREPALPAYLGQIGSPSTFGDAAAFDKAMVGF